MIVPQGMTYTVGVKTYREGDELPADVPDAALLAMGLGPAKTTKASRAQASASDAGSST